MNPNLLKAGKRLFKLLDRNSEALIEGYANGQLNEAELDAKQAQALLQAGLVFRPDADSPLMLSSNLRSLLEEALSDIRNREIDANVGTRLNSLKTLASHYKEARHQGDLAAADAYLQDLTQHTYQLTESLRHSTRALWSRINNEFGYVASLSAKIRENQLAQQQVKELLDSLSLLSFESLSQTAGDIRELRRLLVLHLAVAVEECTQELAVVQSRLLALLGRFRELRGKARLLKGFALHCERQPDYQPKDWTLQSQLPDLLNQPPACIRPAAVDIRHQDHEQPLLSLASKLKPRRHNQHEPEASSELSLEASEEFALSEQQIKRDVEDYLVSSFDSLQQLSALDYLEQNELTWPAEVWLYQVWGSYHALPDEQRQYFSLEHHEEDYGQFTGNRIVTDITVAVR
ncbi:hypothetical protein [Aliagarivorans marinus]|uniref:hypothetical protein n=1 Tax=Aliagarivorans marinus TaxID=561965 RepID=UPI0004245D5B|nr:hypothetical protein [Aliagarivorans marinus]